MNQALNRFVRGRAFVFALIFAWKIALLLLATQPVPETDSFFYDGPVVNFLLHGNYVNPALACALPYSATHVFCAYPPLYQALLLPWMAVFGASVVSAMCFHLVWFGLYLVLLHAILEHLQAPVWCVRLAGLFVLVIWYHDRPDSVAEVLGMAGVLCWVHTLGPPDGAQPSRRRQAWLWGMVACALLCFATSFQIGALYCLLLWVGNAAASWMAHQRPPVAPLLVMTALPPLAIAAVACAFPHLWAGFLEHAQQTPSLSGWHWPHTHEWLKVGRTLPGVFAAAVLFPWAVVANPRAGAGAARFTLLTIASGVAAIALIAASLFLLALNVLMAAAYLQPLVVCGCLSRIAAGARDPRELRLPLLLVSGLVCLGAIPALGLSTWGLACASGMGYSPSMRRVNAELDAVGSNQVVALSAAYLYAAAPRTNIVWLHSDWLQPGKLGDPYSGPLLAQKPSLLILTQFDYYRHYQPELANLESRSPGMRMDIIDCAAVPPPDSMKSFQRVLQNISWAPVVVRFQWQAAR
jgi:hypothetical protein